MQLAFWLVGGAVSAVLSALVASSLRERHSRASLISSVALLLFVLIWFGGFLLCHPPRGLLLAVTLAAAVFGLLFFAPIRRGRVLRITPSDERVDERDTMFAREEYQPGSEKYATYYAEHPEKQAIDDRLRALPTLLGPGGRLYDPQRSEEINEVFAVIEGLTTRVDGSVASAQRDLDPGEVTAQLKQMALRQGAGQVGVAKLDQRYVYSHVGRGPAPWGTPIQNDHPYVIAMTFEMSAGAVAAAPGLPITAETARRYLQGAEVSIALADFIRSMGYCARAHIAGSNYQIMLPPVACAAGLGELGRMGYLISPRYGARMRLGAVTTDLPLVTDQPIAFGVQDFCDRCLKCVANCPAGAIPNDAPHTARGVEKWVLSSERCFLHWRVMGSDCGLCMRVCPFSHPPSWVHNLVRAGISRSPFARWLSVWADDLLYGRVVTREPIRPPEPPQP